MDWLNLISGGVGGSLLGGIFAVVGKLVDLKGQKQAFDHKEAMRRADTDYMVKEAEIGMQRDAISEEGRTARALINARTEATKNDKRTYSVGVLEKWNPKTGFGQSMKSIAVWQMVQVDFMRGVTRPGGLWVITAVAAWFSYNILEKAGWLAVLTPEQLYQLVWLIITTIFSLATMAWTFWYVGKQIDSSSRATVTRRERKGNDDAKDIMGGDASVDSLIGGLRK